MKRLLWGTLLFCFLLTAVVCVAAAEEWICPNCGQTGNTGLFCPNCGQAAPAREWTCPNCGQTGNTGQFCPNCGQAAAQTAATEVNPALEQIPGETNRVRVRVATVEASTYIVNKSEPNRWVPANVNDNNETTCWQFSKKKKNSLKNTWIQLNIGSAQTVDAIWVKNGFWGYNTKGDDLYVINARPRTIRAEFLYAGASDFADALELTLQDDSSRSGWQRLDVGNKRNVTSVRIWVLSAYDGSRYPHDVCLSEVMLVQNASASTAVAASQAGSERIYEGTPAYSSATAVSAGLLMKLATRSGPGTQYDEPGTFFGKNWKTTIVQVTGKYYDNGTWWVEVDFDYSNARYRVWTGKKRVDVNLDFVKEILPQGEGTVDETDVFRGPGSNYAKAPHISDWVDVVAYRQENGYVEIEYYGDNGQTYRGWVPGNAAHISWGTDRSGGN